MPRVVSLFRPGPVLYAGADPENTEPGGVNSINYHTFFFVLHIRTNRGRAPGAPPLNPRLV